MKLKLCDMLQIPRVPRLPWAGVLCSSILLLTSSLALSAPLTPPVAPSPPQDPALTSTVAYPLAPGDVVSISTINFPELTVPQVEVAPDGAITVPVIGEVPVAGKTTEDVAKMLSTRWNDYVVNPVVTVSLLQQRKRDIVFYGDLAKTGTLDYKPDYHIVAAIAELGGPEKTADMAHVKLTHANGETVVLDLTNPDTKAGTDVDAVLTPGDVVFIPEFKNEVSVLGEVNQPGSFEYVADMTILDAITHAGGVKQDTADLDAATLTHNGTESPLDLEGLLKKGNISLNAKITPGDRILIPEIHNRTYIFGAVGKPGYYPFKTGDRVLDALNACTPTTTADLRRVNVIRVDKAKNVAVVTKVDINGLLTGGHMKGNLTLEPGDILYIPEKHHGIGLSDIFSGLSGIGLASSGLKILGLGL